MKHNLPSWQNEQGASLLQLVAALALMAVLSTIAVSNLKQSANPLADASFQATHYLRLVRSRAISQTLTLQVLPTSSTRLEAREVERCSDTSGETSNVLDLALAFPDGAWMTEIDWTVCFTARGLADENILFGITSTSGASRTAEIALGGGIRIQ